MAFLDTKKKYGLDDLVGYTPVSAPPLAIQFPLAARKKDTFLPEHINQTDKIPLDFSNFSSDENKAEKAEAETARGRLFVAAFLQSKGNEKSEFSGSDFVAFVSALEQFGLNSAPAKQFIESISGQSYGDFAKSAHGRVLSYADFKGWGKGGVCADGKFDSARAIQVAQMDNARAGYCAKGTANVLEALGYHVQRGHATTWATSLVHNGWKKTNYTPANAPEGSVLVFKSDKDYGRGINNNGRGAQHGHVEVVARAANGQRLYVSDTVRHNAGGSVPGNFGGVYVYVGHQPAPHVQMAIKHAEPHFQPA